ncbi:FtsX-like permease family protein [Sphingomonas paeninsulae]|jgi:cell division transport system permease protein|uniref:FtsX-like permease family protein n=1 Tax=Sphingomonas paeninsulae TaxID=2319844 RepID=A0A494TNG0_SPHPE|nr:FtsX-like permease family protein [Sphingomonas paeninsulae]AYJ86635.1 FtsX-like permease family protein [Sphingomonas paeninsulae]
MAVRSATVADRGLLPEGRLAGPMPWVIAIMTFLTVLAAAAGLGLGGAASGLGQQLAGRITIQIIEANPDFREQQARRALNELSHLSAVSTFARVDEAKMQALLEPWLGREGLSRDLPVPVLIDVTMAKGEARDVADLTQAINAVAPSAQIEAHAQWLGPLAGLLATLRWLSVGLVALMAAAMAAAVVLAARAALNTHRATIDVMHLMGATDRQVARLFQRRAGLDALFGSLLGFIGGTMIVLFIANRLSAVDAALFDQGGLGSIDWLIIFLVPAGAVALAVVTARATVLRALARML